MRRSLSELTVVSRSPSREKMESPELLLRNVRYIFPHRSRQCMICTWSFARNPEILAQRITEVPNDLNRFRVPHVQSAHHCLTLTQSAQGSHDQLLLSHELRTHIIPDPHNTLDSVLHILISMCCGCDVEIRFPRCGSCRKDACRRYVYDSYHRLPFLLWPPLTEIYTRKCFPCWSRAHAEDPGRMFFLFQCQVGCVHRGGLMSSKSIRWRCRSPARIVN